MVTIFLEEANFPKSDLQKGPLEGPLKGPLSS